MAKAQTKTKVIKSPGYKRMERAMKNFSMKKAKAWRPVINNFAKGVADNFAGEKRTDTGQAWAPLSERYAASKHRGFTLRGKKAKRKRGPKAKRHNILQLTQRLRKAASNASSPNFLIDEAPRKLFLVLYGIPYAAAQNFGYSPRNLPARPYWVTDDGMPVISKKVARTMRDAIKAAVLLYLRRLKG